MLIVSFAWLIAVIALISRALRQRTLFRELSKPLNVNPQTPVVTIIVPARNEEGNIGRCLESLLAQTYPSECFRIIAADDDSTDATPEIVSKYESTGRVSLIDVPPLPWGWTGKSYACWIAASAAMDRSEWFCFVDADIEACPDLMTAAISAAVAEGIEFLSLTPRQQLVTFSERLIMPCGLYLLGFSQDLSKVNSAEGSDVTATGQFILVRSSVYKAIGGHEAVKGDICEDLELARLAKTRGYKTKLLGGTALYSTRMYTGWKSLWLGLSKNLTIMLGGRRKAIVGAAVALALAWAAPLLPIADAIQCRHTSMSCIALLAAAPASAAAFALHLAGTAFFRIPFWYGLIFPLGYTVGAALALDSVRRQLTGKIRWKGRTYS
ncbi:MAG: glycosyltransferase family A protein [Rhodomicrobium sp.]